MGHEFPKRYVTMMGGVGSALRCVTHGWVGGWGGGVKMPILSVM